MLQQVNLNGFTYFADVNNQVLYTDRDKRSGTPFNYLTSNEREQVMHDIRFPRVMSEV